MRKNTGIKGVTSLFAAAILLLGFSSSRCLADLFNGGFETGTLAGWTGVGTGGSSATVKTVHGLWTASEGSYFALLKASGSEKYYELSQSFTPTALGEIVSFNYFFDGDGTTHPVTATARILNSSGTPVGAPLFVITTAESDTPPAPDWATFSKSILDLGLSLGTPYRISFKIANGKTGNPQMYLGIDNVVVPIPAAVLLGVLGLSVAGWKLRKFA